MSSPGELTEQASRVAGKVLGRLNSMLVKKRLSKTQLEACAQELEEAAALVRRVLSNAPTEG